MHARSRLNQASPRHREEGPLDPEGCTGTWYAIDKKLAAELVQLDAEIAGLFRKSSRDEASDYEKAAALYLRQTVDHWLHVLCKTNIISNYDDPLRLQKVRDPALINVLRNLRDGARWDRGVESAPENRDDEADSDGWPVEDESEDENDVEYAPRVVTHHRKRVREQEEEDEEEETVAASLQTVVDDPSARRSYQTSEFDGEVADASDDLVAKKEEDVKPESKTFNTSGSRQKRKSMRNRSHCLRLSFIL